MGTHEEITEKYLTLLIMHRMISWDLAMMTETRNLANGDAVMIINGNWAISQYRNANPDVK